MSLEETKQLLRTYRITPNKLLGQNFMVEASVYTKLCTYASLDRSDIVLDAGAGFGFLTRFLADKCKVVIAVEKDPQVARVLREQIKDFSNVRVVVGDVLKVTLPEFNKIIAIPPYYLSSVLVMWLLERRLDCAILILQKEFASRLNAAAGSDDYSWLTVLTFQHANVELFDEISKEMFYPQPEVDSVIVRFQPWRKPAFEVKDEMLFKQMVKWLFTQRNKKLGKALTPFLKTALRLSKHDAEKLVSRLPSNQRRVRELAPKDFGELSNAVFS